MPCFRAAHDVHAMISMSMSDYDAHSRLTAVSLKDEQWLILWPILLPRSLRPSRSLDTCCISRVSSAGITVLSILYSFPYLRELDSNNADPVHVVLLLPCIPLEHACLVIMPYCVKVAWLLGVEFAAQQVSLAFPDRRF